MEPELDISLTLPLFPFVIQELPLTSIATPKGALSPPPEYPLAPERAVPDGDSLVTLLPD
jgi:hypothetical protein